MPKKPQVVVPEGDGTARRLMVKAKKGSKWGKHRRTVLVIEHGKYVRDEKGNHKTTVQLGEPVNGCYRGTKKVPSANAVKHPETDAPQLSEVMVQIGQELASLPLSEAEFYWEKGELRPGNRFVPYKAVAKKDQAGS